MEEGKTLKIRKRPMLWQAYSFFAELRDMRTRHLQRISANERGVSSLDAQFELDMLEQIGMDPLVSTAKAVMVAHGEQVGWIWKWLTGIKGLGEGGLAAQLLAQIDDIGAFATVSKLWRYHGMAVIDGKIERGVPGEKSHYNRRLKSILFQIEEQFVRQQTPGYSDVYYAEKERQRSLNPVVMCHQCGIPWDDCQAQKAHTREFTAMHLHRRAMRKMGKIFLSHLWVAWRNSEGLPVTKPYVQAIMGHTNMIDDFSNT